MKPEEMPIVEVVRPPKFASKERLVEHVIKHVIRGRDERWHHLIDSELLLEARDECREGCMGKAFDRVTRQYEKIVSRPLVDLCARQRAHQHSCYFRWELSDTANPSKKAVRQVVEAWPEREKLFIVAAAFVKDERITPYRLMTAFRPWPQLSASAHQRKARERVRNRKVLLQQCVLAVHDQ